MSTTSSDDDPADDEAGVPMRAARRRPAFVEPRPSSVGERQAIMSSPLRSRGSMSR